MMIKIIFAVIMVSLSSCVFLTENTLNQTINENSFINRFPQNQKSIIIFKFNGKKDQKIYLCTADNVLQEDESKCIKINSSKNYIVVMTNPGFYYLLANENFNPIFSRQKLETEIKKLNFVELKLEEISYIGDIYNSSQLISEKQNQQEYKILNNKFLLKDNFSALEKLLSNKNSKKSLELSNQNWQMKYLIKQYPFLKNYLKKNLIKEVELLHKEQKQQNKNI